MESGDTNYTWNGPQRFGKKSGRIGNQSNKGHPDHSIVKIGYNTEIES